MYSDLYQLLTIVVVIAHGKAINFMARLMLREETVWSCRIVEPRILGKTLVRAGCSIIHPYKTVIRIVGHSVVSNKICAFFCGILSLVRQERKENILLCAVLISIIMFILVSVSILSRLTVATRIIHYGYFLSHLHPSSFESIVWCDRKIVFVDRLAHYCTLNTGAYNVNEERTRRLLH